MLLDGIVGQDHITGILRQALKAGKPVHGYLFAGPDGLGKRTVGEALAAAVLCPVKPMEGCGQCSSCQRVASGSHPDFHRLRSSDTQIGIDHVRKLQQELSYRAYESSYKVALVEEAERMTPQAANSILKFLEEPLGDSIIILTTNNLSRILPTIISRCQVYRFHPLSEKELAKALVTRGVDKEDAWNRAIEARGITGRALNWDQAENPWSLSETSKFCGELFMSDAGWLFQRTESWSYDAAEAEKVLAGLQDWFRLLLLYMALDGQETYGPLQAELEKQSKLFRDAAGLAAVQELIDTARHALSLHVNVRLILDNLCLSIKALS